MDRGRNQPLIGQNLSYAWFNDKKPKHIARAGLRKHDATNNRIERLNGTVRERVKVQRGWESFKTPIAEGQRIHYNFVKPHQVLEGWTPARVAGIGVEVDNKWMKLLKRATASLGALKAKLLAVGVVILIVGFLTMILASQWYPRTGLTVSASYVYLYVTGGLVFAFGCGITAYGALKKDLIK